MNIIIHLVSAFAVSASTFTAVSLMARAEEVTTTPQQRTVQRICSFDPVADLLPTPQNQPINSPLSYLAQQGFVLDHDGDWLCYVNDIKKQSYYYTIFKVQQMNGKIIASSFLKNGSLIDGQDNRSLDFFMMLIKNHTNATLGNLLSIRRYLKEFISLVKQGKVPASRRGYLFDSPSRGFVSYFPITSEQLQGTAITININMVRKK
ncbi:MAG: hypothetical protein PUP93_26615 [Rhizonema sp. NSF051]|nr:hypothetical protein [Rhizonema sp. NSF051]